MWVWFSIRFSFIFLFPGLVRFGLYLGYISHYEQLIFVHSSRVFDPGVQLWGHRVILNDVAQESAKVQCVTEVVSPSCICVLWPPMTRFDLGYSYACYATTNAVHKFDPGGISSLFFHTAKCRFIMLHSGQITRRAESNLHIALLDVPLEAWIQLFSGLSFASTNEVKCQTHGFANDKLFVYGHGDPIAGLRTSSSDGIAGLLEIHLDTYSYFSMVHGSAELGRDALTPGFPLVCTYGAAVILLNVEGEWGSQFASNEQLWNIFSSVGIQQHLCLFRDETVKIFDPGGHGVTFAEIALSMRDGEGAGSFCLGTKSGILPSDISKLQFYGAKEYG